MRDPLDLLSVQRHRSPNRLSAVGKRLPGQGIQPPVRLVWLIADSRQPIAALQVRWHLEGTPALGSLNAAAADALDAYTHRLDRSLNLTLDILQIRVKLTPTDSSHLATDAAEVLGLAAPRIVIAHGWLLAAYIALHSHVRRLPHTDRSTKC